MNINGSANVFGLYKFCDPKKIKKNVDFNKLEEIEIISNPTSLGYTSEQIVTQINQFFKNQSFTSSQKPPTSFSSSPSAPSLPPAQPQSIPTVTMPAAATYISPQKSNSLVEDYIDKTIKNKEQPAMSKVEQAMTNAPTQRPIQSFEEEQRREEKLQILDSITSLKKELSKLGISLQNIHEVNENNSYEDVRTIYRMLLYKKNTKINYEIARDFILCGIDGLTYCLNGQETSWGRMPDLRGWDATAKTKMASLKVELSSIVSESLRYYGIGPLGQIGLSLVPSAIVHMNMNGRQQNRQQIDIDAGESMMKLNELKNRNN